MFRKNEGFTLVELIVVIAILAILAGVAVPAYSGYIQKANEAADWTLLGTVNTAFGAAIVENGYAVEEVANATIKLDENGKITQIVDVRIDAAQLSNAQVTPKYLDATEFTATFMKYFAGNEGVAFKVLGRDTGKLHFDPKAGGFTDGGESTTVAYGGGKITIAGADKDKINDSTFIKSETLGGVDGLLHKVDTVTDFAALLNQAGNAMNDVYTDPAFLAYMYEAMGLPANPTNEQLSATLKDLTKPMTDAGMSFTDAASKVQANAAVLYTANQAANVNKSEITDLLTGEGVRDKIAANLTGEDKNTGAALTQAALAYGMYTAFANSDKCTDSAAKDYAPNEVLNHLNDAEFQAYIGSAQGQKDMDAYISALNAINSSSKDTSAVNTLLSNGFADQDLIDAITSALGQ